MKFDFSRGKWNTDSLTYAYSYRFPETPEFIQNDDSIENAENPESTCMGYDFVTLMSREKFKKGTVVTTKCSLSGLAAPLLVFADSLDLCEDGHYRYGNYFEVVLYKDGINVWRLSREADGEVHFHKKLGAIFPVEADTVHTLSAVLNGEALFINADGKEFELRFEDKFDEVHIGINACEGTCKFYSLEIGE